MPSKGEKIRVLVPVQGCDDAAAEINASEAVARACSQRGLHPTSLELVSSEPWTEPIDGFGPFEGITVYIYEATAALSSSA